MYIHIYHNIILAWGMNKTGPTLHGTNSCYPLPFITLLSWWNVPPVFPCFFSRRAALFSCKSYTIASPEWICAWFFLHVVKNEAQLGPRLFSSEPRHASLIGTRLLHLCVSKDSVFFFRKTGCFFGKSLMVIFRLGLPPATQDASHHQDYYMSSRESQPRPSFAKVTGWGVDPIYRWVLHLQKWRNVCFFLVTLSECWGLLSDTRQSFTGTINGFFQ